MIFIFTTGAGKHSIVGFALGSSSDSSMKNPALVSISLVSALEVFNDSPVMKSFFESAADFCFGSGYGWALSRAFFKATAFNRFFSARDF